MRHLKQLFVFALMTLFSVGVWGAEQVAYTLTPAAGSNNNYANACDVTINGITWNVTGNASLTPWRIGGKSLTAVDREVYSKTAMSNAITKVELTVGAASGITVNSLQLIVASNEDFSTVVDEVTEAFAANSTITFTPTSPLTEWATGAYYKFVFNVTVSGTSNKFVAFSEAKFYKEVATETCETPTFSPAAGTFYGSQEITLATNTTDASIYYTTDNSTPSSSNGTLYSAPFSIDATTTIKAIAVKAGATDSGVAEATYTLGASVTSFNIDFETNNLAAYVNWDFVNIACATSTITAHGGTYYGNTDGKASASITTKATYANPGLLTFYTSKESGNTTASSWIVQVSDDGSDWSTEIETFDATAGNKGDWTAREADLSGHTDVYIRIAYSGSTAVRAIDDISLATATAVAKPTISGDENFVTSTTVTISHADADHIYYTTNGDAPTTSSTEYTAPFSLTNTAIVKAIAVKGSDVSSTAEKTFTKVEALATMAEVQAEAAASEKAINVTITNWVVTAVSGSQVWFADADNTKGILLYKSGHGFEAGKKLNGTVVGTKIKLYNLYPELTSLVASEVTVTDAEAISPRTTTIAALTSGHPAEQGTVVKLEDVTYSSSDAALSDGVNTIAADNKFFSSLALVDGTTYDITGVVTYYKNGDDAVVKIAPRAATDVEAKSAVVIPTAANLAALKAAARGTYILTLTNAVVTYVNGNNAFIEDATGGALIYFASHGYSAGDCLNGDYQVVTTDYQGKFEITAMEPQTGAATTTAEIPLTTVSIATLNASFSSYESRRIKIVNANVTDAIGGSDRNGAINDGAAVAVYAAAGASTITLTANDNVDIIGYPGFHNTDQQLNVWQQTDITVNEKLDPEISWDTESAELTLNDYITPGDYPEPVLIILGDLGANPLDFITLSSDNESLATINKTTDGQIKISWVPDVAGTVHFTATFAGNDTYKAVTAVCTVTIHPDPASLSPWASVYTSNVTLSTEGGTSASAAKVKFYGEEGDGYDAIKAGTGSAQGAVVVNVPAQATKLHFHAYGWTSESVGLTVTAPTGVTVSPATEISINSNSGIKENSPFTLAEGSDPKTDAYYAVSLSGNTEATNITISATSGKRFVLFGVNQEGGVLPVLESIEISGDLTNKAYEAGATLDMTGLTVEATYSLGGVNQTPVDITSDPGLTWTYDPLVVDQTSVEITANFGGKTDSKVIDGLTVVDATPEIKTDANSRSWTVEEGADIPAAKTFTVTLKNVAAATATLGGTNPGAFTIDKTALVDGEVISVSVVSTATAGTYTATITITDNALVAADKVVNVTLTVNAPETAISTSSKWVAATTTDLVDGAEVLIIGVDGDDVYAMGEQGGNNRAAVLGALDASVFTPGAKTMSFTLEDQGDGTFALKTSNDKYLYAAASGSNHMKTQATVNDNAKWTLTTTSAVAESSSNRNVMQFNSSSSIFSCYGSASQKPIQFYVPAPAPKYSVTYAANGGAGDAPAAVEYEEGETFAVAAADLFTAPAGKEFDKWNDGTNDYAPGATYTVGTADVVLTAQWKDATPDPVYTDVRTGLTAGNYYTICHNKKMTAIKGATLWEFVGKDASMAYIAEAEAPYTAGKPYILYATADKLEAVLEGDAVDETALVANNGLHGTFSNLVQEHLDGLATTAGADLYLVIGNQLRRATGAGTGSNSLNAYRAYVIVDEITGGKPSAAPGRNVRSMPMHKDTATGMDELNASETPVKMIIDGKLYILRGEKMYNANGQLVK